MKKRNERHKTQWKIYNMQCKMKQNRLLMKMKRGDTKLEKEGRARQGKEGQCRVRKGREGKAKCDRVGVRGRVEQLRDECFDQLMRMTRNDIKAVYRDEDDEYSDLHVR